MQRSLSAMLKLHRENCIEINFATFPRKTGIFLPSTAFDPIRDDQRHGFISGSKDFFLWETYRIWAPRRNVRSYEILHARSIDDNGEEEIRFDRIHTCYNSSL